MKERPILFSGSMVRALLAGTKTQTRRVVKPQPDSRPGMECTRVLFKNRKGDLVLDEAAEAKEPRLCAILCPYGQPGDRLWVREAFMHEPADYCWEASVSIPCRPAETVYRADFPNSQPGEGWKPSIHMPRKLSRISLEITGVRVERLQDINEQDAAAEGVATWAPGALSPDSLNADPSDQFRWLWSSINGPDSWSANPWVWVVEFKRVQQASSGRPSQLEDAPCSA
ncbi:ASCH domain-containing protein [Delftia tsuruhatensis]|uniref:hypothetical protein n=1 Tax=Delftia tsuruhatensis TaxID=180282 RepID=UPI002260E78A|nr:hypothetical protein [Delftia tsuruhatensis]MCX7509460.1 hypothetical protein [Delftia tsuruhatensis]